MKHARGGACMLNACSHRAGAKGYMYVARPSPRPSAVEMMSQAPEQAKRRVETGRGININNVPIYHSLQASVPAVPRHRSNPELFDARTLFNKVGFPADIVYWFPRAFFPSHFWSMSRPLSVNAFPDASDRKIATKTAEENAVCEPGEDANVSHSGPGDDLRHLFMGRLTVQAMIRGTHLCGVLTVQAMIRGINSCAF